MWIPNEPTKLVEVARPADGDGRGGEQVLEQQVPADEPGQEGPEGRVGVGVGRAGGRDHRGQLRVAERGQPGGDPGEDERDDHGRARRTPPRPAPVVTKIPAPTTLAMPSAVRLKVPTRRSPTARGRPSPGRGSRRGGRRGSPADILPAGALPSDGKAAVRRKPEHDGEHSPERASTTHDGLHRGRARAPAGQAEGAAERGIEPYPPRVRPRPHDRGDPRGVPDAGAGRGHRRDRQASPAGSCSLRRHGELVFADLHDQTGTIQLFVSHKDLGDERFEDVAEWDRGDWVGVDGQR